jgi:heme-degrading monooxygenase HmoA
VILEVAILNIRPNAAASFEADFKKAEKYICSIEGYQSHSLMKCVNKEGQYLLQVYWNRIEDHKIGFRTSEAYVHWKELLHHYYNPFPEVNYYQDVLK